MQNCFYSPCRKTSSEHKWIWQLLESMKDCAKVQMHLGLLSSPRRKPGPLGLTGIEEVGGNGRQATHILHLTLSFHSMLPRFGLRIWVSQSARHLTTLSSFSLAGYSVSLPSSPSFLLPNQPLLPCVPFSMSPSKQSLTAHPLHLGRWSLAPCPPLCLPPHPLALGSCCLLPERLDSCWAL